MTKLKGIIDIHGEQGVGKTIMAIGIAPTEEIAYLFDDVKGLPEGIEPSDFGFYADLVQLRKDKKLLEYREIVFETIDKIPSKVSVIVIDTWARFGTALTRWAKQNIHLLREESTMSPKKAWQFREGQEWGEAYEYEKRVISDLNNRFESVVLVSHIKDQYRAGTRTGAMEPAIDKRITPVFNFRVWLRRSEGGVPIALVHKPIAVLKKTKTGIVPTNLLPRKLKPLPEDTSVWDMIERYRKEPFGNRQPTEDETPDDYELSILDGILTEDQKEIWQAEQREKQRQEKLEDSAKSFLGYPAPHLGSAQ